MKYNKSEKRITINKKTLIAALDIGKKIHYGYFRDASGQRYSTICVS